MATGFLEDGICFTTSQEALDFHFQGIPPSFLITTSTSTLQEYLRLASGQWNLRKATIATSGVQTQVFSTAVPALVQPSCTLPNTAMESFTDGAILGWGIVAAMVAAWAIKSLSKGL